MGCDGRIRARQSEAGRRARSLTGKEVWADSAYRSAQIEARLKAKGLQSRIHRRAARNHPLSERQKSANTTRSKVL
jgi:transposase, IS5 family